MTFLEITTPTPEQLAAVVELDRLCFGGLWQLAGYQGELNSPYSDLLIISPLPNTALHNQANDIEANNHHIIEAINPLDTSNIIGLGCLNAILEEAHITMIGIHPDFRRLGLGQAMFYALLLTAWRRGLERATLEVSVANNSAISLYKKFGFREAGRRPKYYATGEDALILWLNGLHYPEFPDILAKWEKEIFDRAHRLHWQLIIPQEILPPTSNINLVLNKTN